MLVTNLKVMLHGKWRVFKVISKNKIIVILVILVIIITSIFIYKYSFGVKESPAAAPVEVTDQTISVIEDVDDTEDVQEPTVNEIPEDVDFEVGDTVFMPDTSDPSIEYVEDYGIMSEDRYGNRYVPGLHAFTDGKDMSSVDAIYELDMSTLKEVPSEHALSSYLAMGVIDDTFARILYSLEEFFGANTEYDIYTKFSTTASYTGASQRIFYANQKPYKVVWNDDICYLTQSDLNIVLED